MICLKAETMCVDSKVKVVKLLSDTTPASLTLTGADVSNLSDDITFAPGSMLIVKPDSLYICGESGTFYKWEG